MPCGHEEALPLDRPRDPRPRRGASADGRRKPRRGRRPSAAASSTPSTATRRCGRRAVPAAWRRRRRSASRRQRTPDMLQMNSAAFAYDLADVLTDEERAKITEYLA